ncbi:hypothetical protein [Streptomyces caniscabiei]|uniref:Tetratricopeptide repeat protein n=1 Tax=Streptomyces caniscabiei TaxID=2746961 RepID=A0ABU4N241_9ACTN|nr:hypothetical protein [Streptomyces caniscabiei]MBE4735026.1 hypothetical protein [Streptomyces caniscabiei]MBE4754160.1 hypothetical protein [Streptomyces caniscabiei]MBE4767752.1 hypothetical protein [Streptomyces caniscabiei]MBE4784211.1 hypothetical protein [Streptomyces caniscabiei]MBE4791290.1 hypothetical protein [Streptomyces caniscabiei]
MKWRRRPKSGTSADGAEPEPSPTHGTGPAGEDPDADVKQRVGALFSEAQERMLEGLSPQAVPLQQEARRLMHLLVDRNPDDLEARRMLGSLLYGLGSTLAAAHQPDQALAVLTECAGVYEALAGAGESGMAPLLADVHARKAQALTRLGHGMSAVVESDQAVMAYLDLGADSGDSPLNLDLARVLSMHAGVLYEYGDRDLAVCAADWAVRYYFAKAGTVNGGPPAEAFTHGRYLRQAAAVAARVHTQQGRAEIALAVGATEVHSARVMALPDGPDDRANLASALTRHGLNLRVAGRTAEGNDLVREARGIDPAVEADATREWQELTGRSAGPGRLHTSYSAAIAAAVRLLGENEVPSVLRDLAFDPAAGATTVTSSLRCPPQSAPGLATLLALVAVRLLDDPDPSATRAAGLLGREAHCLFASASQDREAEAMHQRFREFGGSWARLLLALIPTFAASPGAAALAEDLTGWLGGVALQLQPFTFVDEPTRRLVEQCTALIERQGS